MRAVAVVTDSTASLPEGLAGTAEVTVVPLHVAVDGENLREGVDLSPAQLLTALRSRATVTTSQPGPESFARVYAHLASLGAREIVSVHLSAQLSGTVTSAQLAAQTTAVPVHVVDSRTVGMGLGFAAIAAARAAGEGTGGWQAACAAEACARSSDVLFAVDTLEHLRRGGRLGPVAAAVGTVLGMRPVLGVRDGALHVVEKVRTSARARERILERTRAEASRRRRCQVAVHHLGQPELADQLAQSLRDGVGPTLRTVHIAEISAVVGAHVGPGLIATVVADA